MFQGINCVDGDLANKITKLAFKKGLMIETSGADDHVIKFLCPLTITDQNLKKGIDILEESIEMVCEKVTSFDEEVDYFNENYSV
jgi:diaminobutyrate-2-oxoglutarate transaminase